MIDNFWRRFLLTGSVGDYLKYKEQEKLNFNDSVLKDENNGDIYKGLGYKGTDDRGE